MAFTKTALAIVIILSASIQFSPAQDPEPGEATTTASANQDQPGLSQSFKPAMIVLLRVDDIDLGSRLTKLVQDVAESAGGRFEIAFNVGPKALRRSTLILASESLSEESIAEIVERVSDYDPKVKQNALTDSLVTRMFPSASGGNKIETRIYPMQTENRPGVIAAMLGRRVWESGWKSINVDAKNRIIVVANEKMQTSMAQLIRGVNQGHTGLELNALLRSAQYPNDAEAGSSLSGAEPLVESSVERTLQAVESGPLLMARSSNQLDLTISPKVNADRIGIDLTISPMETAKLRERVAEAFTIKQANLRSELEALRSRLEKMESTIQRRDEISDQIIDRRVAQLLTPETEWEPNSGPTKTLPPTSGNETMTRVSFEYYDTDPKLVRDVLATLLPGVKVIAVRDRHKKEAGYDHASQMIGKGNSSSRQGYHGILVSSSHVSDRAHRIVKTLCSTKNECLAIDLGKGQRLCTYHFEISDLKEAYELFQVILDGQPDTRLSMDRGGRKLILVTKQANLDLLNQALSESNFQ